MKKAPKIVERKVITPRKWQVEACATILPVFLSGGKRNFLVEAGVGSGKTVFAGLVSTALLPRLPKIVVVSPTESVQRGFVDTFAGMGIQLDSVCDSQQVTGFHGYSITYQALLTNQFVVGFVDENTLVIFDEPHHMLDDESSAWFQAAQGKLARAGMTLSMTGTPFRDGDKRIPFCTYAERNGVLELVPDYRYTYGDSVRDGVCARASFRFAQGSALVKEGKRVRKIATGTAMTSSDEATLLKCLLDPTKDFVRDILSAHLEDIQELRETTPNAAGLVVCIDIKHAKAVSKVLEGLGVSHVTITGDDKKSQREIRDFRVSLLPVSVAVKMITEGTDIPRIKAIAYLCNVKTMLFLMQVLGRATRKTTETPEECRMRFPDIPTFKRFTMMVEEGIRHAVPAPVEDEEEEEPEPMPEDGGAEFKHDHKILEVLSTTYMGEVNLTLFDGFQVNPEPPLVDRKEDMRVLLSAMGQNFGKTLALQYKGDIGTYIRDTNVQANAIVGVEYQKDMTLEQLERKHEILSEWMADHGIRIPTIEEVREYGK